MKKKDYTVGYIEGFYGRLLNWKERKLIVDSLKKNQMNTYFYAPKEDVNHRVNWRKKYTNTWRQNFRDFAIHTQKRKINTIVGISPGLDFNFEKFYYQRTKNFDFLLLLKKAKLLLKDGASSIALLLDDIPNDFKTKFDKTLSEGICHAILANTLSNSLKQKIYFVPRIYADELIHEDPNYLYQLSRTLDTKIKIFYCGQNIVSRNLLTSSKIKNMFRNQIIFWDNYYANDYCPRRLFIGPYTGRKKVRNIMINLTGLLHTDLLILDIFSSNFDNDASIKSWEKTLEKHNVPKIFVKIKKFFLKPDFGSNPSVKTFNVNTKDYEALDFLLWKWKGSLSREWYPYLLGLKQDLQINKNNLSSERVIKTQTLPLTRYIIKGDF